MQQQSPGIIVIVKETANTLSRFIDSFIYLLTLMRSSTLTGRCAEIANAMENYENHYKLLLNIQRTRRVRVVRFVAVVHFDLWSCMALLTKITTLSNN